MLFVQNLNIIASIGREAVISISDTNASYRSGIDELKRLFACTVAEINIFSL